MYDWPGRFKPFHAQRETVKFLTMRDRGYVLSGMGCVDSETEYLSPTGWVRIADYVGGMVAQYNPDLGSIEFVEPTEYVKLPCPEMLRIKTKYGLDQLLSPEHRVLLQSLTNQNKREVVQAHELFRRHEHWVAGGKTPRSASVVSYSDAAIPTTFSTVGGPGIELTDAQLRVQVAVIADGHFNSGTHHCVMRLKKERKKERLRLLLSFADIDYKERECGSVEGFSVFSFYAPWRVKEFDDRFWKATEAQLWVIAKEVLNWDSNVSVAGDRGDRFSSFVKASSDFVQYAMAATGRTARVNAYSRDRRGATETEYVVQIRSNAKPVGIAGVHTDGSRISAMGIEPSTDGYKYCFMVPSTFLLFRRNGCIFASGNTGKTMAALWSIDFLMKSKEVTKCLVIAPLSTLERAWGDSIFYNLPERNFVVLHGSRERRLKLLAEDVDFYIINTDGVKIILEALADRPDIDLIVVDELATARNSGTDRWKAINAICNKQHPRKVWGMTGTPTPNAPTDAWAQCRIVTPSSVPPYFGRFRDKVMRQVTQWKWVPREEALETVRQAMQPNIRFALEDCVDLPPQIFETRDVELSTEQRQAYREMLVRLHTEVGEGQITAVNEAVKMLKLLQIATGCVFDNTGEVVELPNEHRNSVVEEICEEAEGKVIVFVPFTAALHAVAKRLSKSWEVAVVHGGTPKHERDEIFKAFQNEGGPRVIVANAGTMSHGLTLTAATVICWYAPIMSHETYSQACARVRRPGQTKTTVIVHVAGSEVERLMYERLKNKEAMQGLLLKMLKERTNA